MQLNSSSSRRVVSIVAGGVIPALVLGVAAHAQLSAQTPELVANAELAVASLMDQLRDAVIRLPLAALLGTILALRPRRHATTERKMPVVETQVILAVVGALIMLVVG